MGGVGLGSCVVTGPQASPLELGEMQALEAGHLRGLVLGVPGALRRGEGQCHPRDVEPCSVVKASASAPKSPRVCRQPCNSWVLSQRGDGQGECEVASLTLSEYFKLSTLTDI